MKQPKRGVITQPLPWRRFFDNKYLSSHDLTEGLTLKIKEMRYEEVKGEKGRTDECLIAVFENEDVLPMIINTTNSKRISEMYNTKLPVEWVGKYITVFVDPAVKNPNGEVVGGLRIRPTVPKVKLPKIDAKRFEAMCKAIEAKEFSIDKAVSMFDFTQAQSTKLIELRTKLI